MIEFIISIIFLFIGAITQNVNYFIASGLFCIAENIGQLIDSKGRR